jgi:hypothetical protein
LLLQGAGRPSSLAGSIDSRKEQSEMSFVAVFTASAMGFTILVPIAMVAVLLVYGAPARRAVPVSSDPKESRAARQQRGGADHGDSTDDHLAVVTRLAA